jgi:hypothetical protein
MAAGTTALHAMACNDGSKRAAHFVAHTTACAAALDDFHFITPKENKRLRDQPAARAELLLK